MHFFLQNLTRKNITTVFCFWKKFFVLLRYVAGLERTFFLFESVWRFRFLWIKYICEKRNLLTYFLRSLLSAFINVPGTRNAVRGGGNPSGTPLLFWSEITVVVSFFRYVWGCSFGFCRNCNSDHFFELFREYNLLFLLHCDVSHPFYDPLNFFGSIIFFASFWRVPSYFGSLDKSKTQIFDNFPTAQLTHMCDTQTVGKWHCWDTCST